MMYFLFFLSFVWVCWLVSLAGLDGVLGAFVVFIILDHLKIIDKLRDALIRFSDSEVRDCASKHDLPLDYRTGVDCDKCPTSKYLYCKKLFESQSFSSDQERSDV